MHIRAMAMGCALAVLAGCGSDGGSGGSAPRTHVSCADVRNAGQASRCAQDPPGILDRLIPAAHAITFQRGTISRAQLVDAELTVVSPVNFSGEVEAAFDAGCGGAAQWVLMPRQAFSVTAGQTITLAASGQCGDMPLGARTFTISVWRQNGALLDQAVVTFTLTE